MLDIACQMLRSLCGVRLNLGGCFGVGWARCCARMWSLSVLAFCEAVTYASVAVLERVFRALGSNLCLIIGFQHDAGFCVCRCR